jgi:hypothetical protein
MNGEIKIIFKIIFKIISILLMLFFWGMGLYSLYLLFTGSSSHGFMRGISIGGGSLFIGSLFFFLERYIEKSICSEKKQEMNDKVKNCLFCGEEILAVAKKCKHCSSNLDESVSEKVLKPTTDYGIFLLAIPVATTMLIWFWVSGMNLFQSPGNTMTLLMLATVLGTAIVAAMEASKAGMKSDRKKGTYSATAWFFIITLFWIIGYPVYLYKRKHYGLTNRLVAGILIALIFVGSWGIMNTAIDTKKEEIRSNLGLMQQ